MNLTHEIPSYSQFLPKETNKSHQTVYWFLYGNVTGSVLWFQNFCNLWPSDTLYLLSIHRSCPGLKQNKWMHWPFWCSHLPRVRRNSCDSYSSWFSGVFPWLLRLCHWEIQCEHRSCPGRADSRSLKVKSILKIGWKTEPQRLSSNGTISY